MGYLCLRHFAIVPFDGLIRIKVYDIMSVSEQEQATLAQGERRMTTMNEVHGIMSRIFAI